MAEIKNVLFTGQRRQLTSLVKSCPEPLKGPPWCAKKCQKSVMQ
jgi:hypothetical protein